VNELFKHCGSGGICGRENLSSIVRQATNIRRTHLSCPHQQVGINVGSLENHSPVSLESCSHSTQISRIDWLSAYCEGK
jgi:hypothetical protein